MRALSIQKTNIIPATRKYQSTRIVNSFVEINVDTENDIEAIIKNPLDIWPGPSELAGNNIKCYYSSDNTVKDSTLSVLVTDMNSNSKEDDLLDEFCGSVVFVAENPETKEITDMNDEQINTVKRIFRPIRIAFRKTDIDVFTFIHHPVKNVSDDK